MSSAWLRYRGTFTDYFTTPGLIATAINEMNARGLSCHSHFSSSQEFVGKMETCSFRLEVLAYMYKTHKVPVGLTMDSLNEVIDENLRALGYTREHFTQLASKYESLNVNLGVSNSVNVFIAGGAPQVPPPTPSLAVYSIMKSNNQLDVAKEIKNGNLYFRVKLPVKAYKNNLQILDALGVTQGTLDEAEDEAEEQYEADLDAADGNERAIKHGYAVCQVVYWVPQPRERQRRGTSVNRRGVQSEKEK